MLIIDTHNLCWKSHYTTGGLSSSDGDGTGIILGFLNQLIKQCEVWDESRPLFPCDNVGSLRKEVYNGYKLKDDSSLNDKDLEALADTRRQIEVLKNKVLPMIGFNNIFEYDGYEADDIIAAIVINGLAGHRPLVLSTDEDYFQLLDYCNIYSSGRKKVDTKATFIRQYGIVPKDWIKVKQIAGCTSDKVPGVVGVGNPTAIKYLRSELKPKLKTAQKIRQHRRDGLYERNRKLVELPFEGCPVPEITPDEFSPEGLLAVCEEYEFFSIENQIRRWEKRFGGRR